MLCLWRMPRQQKPRGEGSRCEGEGRGGGTTRAPVRLVCTAVVLPLLARGGPAAPLITAVVLLACAAPPALLPTLPCPAPRRPTVFQLLKASWETVAPLRRLLWRLYGPLRRLENGYLRMANISFMINQVMFFSLCDRLLLEESRVAGLYSLMFYNVLAYCVGYVKELLLKEDWSPYVTITEHSHVKHLAMSATKIVLEWTKAVTFVITVVFMLLVFGLEEGLHHYRPTVLYTLVTGLFYACTEKVFAESFPALLQWLAPAPLEGLEALWAPVLLRVAAAALSSGAAVALLVRRPAAWRVPVAALYFNVWLRAREAAAGCALALHKERAAVARFRFATADELAELEDVCAVCLSGMRRARVTPCQHLFHSECLRQCLQRSSICPICKRELVFH